MTTNDTVMSSNTHFHMEFKQKIITTPGERHQAFEVYFARGSVISCRTRAEAEAMTARHLERARRHGVEDQVIAAVWLLPKWRRKVAQ